MPCTSYRQRGDVTGCEHRWVGRQGEHSGAEASKAAAQVGVYARAERYSGDERLQKGTVNGDVRSFLRQIGWYRGVHRTKHTRPLKGKFPL
jgi:hypothetical protein